MANLNHESFNRKFFPDNPIPKPTFNRLCSRNEIHGCFKLGAKWFVNEEVFESEGLPILLGHQPVIEDNASDQEETAFVLNLVERMRA